MAGDGKWTWRESARAKLHVILRFLASVRAAGGTLSSDRALSGRRACVLGKRIHSELHTCGTGVWPSEQWTQVPGPSHALGDRDRTQASPGRVQVQAVN